MDSLAHFELTGTGVTTHGSMADGPAAALELVDGLGGRLDNYHLLPSVRGDLLAKLGRPAEARAEFERAAGLTANERERDLLLARPRSVRERRHRPARLLGLAAGPQARAEAGSAGCARWLPAWLDPRRPARARLGWTGRLT